MPTDFLHAASFGDGTPYAQNLLYLPPGSTSASQRQQANQLYINTQLSPCQINDSDNSTASSTSFNILQTPFFELYPSFQPSIHIALPQSASSESGMLIPVRGRNIQDD